MNKWLLIGLALMGLSSCSNKEPDLKSPCVGIDGSPCVHRQVNDWWHPEAS